MLQYYPSNNIPASSNRLANNSITTTSEPQTVHVYPNPAKDELTISISSESVNNYKVELIDLLGKIVLTENVNANLYSLPLKGIDPGIYICRVLNEKGDILFKDKLTIIK
jgi:hypothetical protein